MEKSSQNFSYPNPDFSTRFVIFPYSLTVSLMFFLSNFCVWLFRFPSLHSVFSLAPFALLLTIAHSTDVAHAPYVHVARPYTVHSLTFASLAAFVSSWYLFCFVFSLCDKIDRYFWNAKLAQLQFQSQVPFRCSRTYSFPKHDRVFVSFLIPFHSIPLASRAQQLRELSLVRSTTSGSQSSRLSSLRSSTHNLICSVCRRQLHPLLVYWVYHFSLFTNPTVLLIPVVRVRRSQCLVLYVHQPSLSLNWIIPN